jgi:hypothetical protein
VNFQALCEQVAEEVNGRPLTFSSVLLSVETDPFKRRVIRAVSKAYMDVLSYSRHWKFLNKRGTLLTLRADIGEYMLSAVQSVDWNSLYLTEVGTDARFPVLPQDYQVWQAREQGGATSDGVPLWMIQSDVPNKWIFWPTPTKEYVLNGNLQYKPIGLEQAADEPLWDEQFHEMLVWFAVRWLEGRVKSLDEKVGALNVSEAQRASETQFRAFCKEYLPSIRRAEGFC